MRQMINHTRFVTLLGYTIVALLAASVSGSARAQTEQRCFPETGFCFAGRIREFWEQNGGLPVFGFPVGSQHEDLIEGRPFQVQWFERNRLELHPENAQPYDVLLGRLGADRLAQQGRAWQAFPQSAAVEGCRYFPETGHNACGDILAAWHASGLEFDGVEGKSEAENLALFGLPLSDPQTESIEGKPYTVQWFERARFELHPENDPPYNVLFGLLGNEIRVGGTPPAPTQPIPTPTPTPTVTPTQTPAGGSTAGIPAQLDFITPGPGDCLLSLKPGDTISGGDTSVATPFVICLSKFAANQEITIKIVRADGSVALSDETLTEGSGSGGWRGFLLPGEPLGKYTLTATQGQRKAKGSFTLIRAKSPRLAVYPSHGAPGKTFQVGVAGYQDDPNKVVMLHLYRSGKYLKALPPVAVNKDGEAVVSLATKSSDQEAQYIVVAEPIKSTYSILDPGIFTLNR